MKRAVSATGALVLVLTLSTGHANAQTVANGTYYAPPSWNLALPVTTRFIVLANFNQEAVLDRETGLVWERNPATASTIWATAFTECAKKLVGGRSGWRLPSLDELGSLVAGPDETLPAGHPFANNAGSSWTWSRTSVLENTAFARRVEAVPGEANVFQFLKTFDAHYWCVRGGSAEK